MNKKELYKAIITINSKIEELIDKKAVLIPSPIKLYIINDELEELLLDNIGEAEKLRKLAIKQNIPLSKKYRNRVRFWAKGREEPVKIVFTKSYTTTSKKINLDTIIELESELEKVDVRTKRNEYENKGFIFGENAPDYYFRKKYQRIKYTLHSKNGWGDDMTDNSLIFLFRKNLIVEIADKSDTYFQTEVLIDENGEYIWQEVSEEHPIFFRSRATEKIEMQLLLEKKQKQDVSACDPTEKTWTCGENAENNQYDLFS